MTKTFLILLAIIAVVGIGYWWVNGNKDVKNTTINSEQTETSTGENAPADEKTTTPPSIEDLAVTYSGNGFSPATVTVKKGQKVTFKNDSGKSMWVASDNHPSHTIYPEFDAKTGTANGSAYEFTFDKVGTWGYHDHLSTSRTGIVIVE